MGKIARVVVCGSKVVGKTAILQQLAFGIDITGEAYIPTIDDTYTIQADPERNSTLILHDTAGLDSANCELRKCYTVIADAFILIYSIDNADTFNRMDLTKTFVEKAIKERKEPNIPIVILANKIDLTTRMVEKDFAFSWAQREKLKLFEVSAKDRRTLIEPIDYLCTKLFTTPKETKFTLAKRIKEKQPGAAIVMDI